MNGYEWNCEEIMRKWETNVEKTTGNRGRCQEKWKRQIEQAANEVVKNNLFWANKEHERCFYSVKRVKDCANVEKR